MINQAIIERHAELAFRLWLRRRTAQRAGNYKLMDLARLDARIDANLEALLLAGQVGIDTCTALLDPEVPETFAVFTYLAQRLNAQGALARALAAAVPVPNVGAGFVVGLSFVPPSELSVQLTGWLSSNDRAVQALALDVATAHRFDPGAALDGDWPMESARWLAAAARAVGGVGLVKRLPWVYLLLEHGDPEVRFAAAVTVIRLRGALRERALGIVDEVAAQPELALSGFALPFSIRMRDAGAFAQYTAKRAALAPATRHLAAAAAGTVAAIEELVLDCQDPKLSRTAANAFALITGVDLEFEDLEGRPPPPDPAAAAPAISDDDLIDEDGLPNLPPYREEQEDEASEGLLWPDGEKLKAYWQRVRGRFAAEQRYLGGLPIAAEGARQVLSGGSQQARYEAAWELALREQGPLFNTTAPSRQQRASA